MTYMPTKKLVKLFVSYIIKLVGTIVVVGIPGFCYCSMNYVNIHENCKNFFSLIPPEVYLFLIYRKFRS
jgi:hypothetical protein